MTAELTKIAAGNKRQTLSTGLCLQTIGIHQVTNVSIRG